MHRSIKLIWDSSDTLCTCMHHSGPLPQNFEGPEQDYGAKYCQNVSQGKPCCYQFLLNKSSVYVIYLWIVQL